MDIQPVMNVGGGSHRESNDCQSYGMMWMWLIVIFALMGGNGFGGGNANAAAANQSAIYASNDWQTLGDQIRGVSYGISDATFSLTNSVNNLGQNLMRDNFDLQKTVMQGDANSNTIMQQGFCGINQNIDSLKYEGALNTCKITSNATENTQRILDKLNCMEMSAKDNEIANLRQQVSALGLSNSQMQQNAYLVNSLRPFPVPTFAVPRPYCNCTASSSTTATTTTT